MAYTPAHVIPTLKFNVYDDYETTNDYVPSEEVETLEYDGSIMWLKNKHESNDLLYGIEVLVNEDDWERLAIDESLSAGDAAYEVLNRNWYKIRFTAKSAAPDSPATIEAWITRKMI